jgi:imidazolonepropionase-like amidohydrolase
VGPNTAVGLPPVPQRPDLAARAPHDSADDLEMLDEEDLELMEELAEDAGDEAPADPAAAMSSPEWKRALADAQGE